MSVIFSMGPFRDVHNINLKSKNGRVFAIDIYHGGASSYDSTVTILDNVSQNQGSWLYDVEPATASEDDNFKAAIELVLRYLGAVDPEDVISDIHNPCNCPFVSQGHQDEILSSLGVNLTVRVN